VVDHPTKEDIVRTVIVYDSMFGNTGETVPRSTSSSSAARRTGTE
jgi:hypothetical protein